MKIFRQAKGFGILFSFSVLSLGIPIASQAQTLAPALLVVPRSEAVGHIQDVYLYDGRATAIDFSGRTEIVTSILLADPSKTVYTTDYPLESGQARTIFLRPIQKINFPSATSTSITNLWVKTRTSSGTERLYAFNLIPNGSDGVRARNGVQISPIAVATANNSDDNPNRLIVSGNRRAGIEEIERGLEIAIASGFTPPDDPIVYRLNEFLVTARNSGLNLHQAASDTGVSLVLLTKLAELALSEPRGANVPLFPQEPARIERSVQPESELELLQQIEQFFQSFRELPRPLI